MKKMILILGSAAGFICGSKARTGPYTQLESKVRSLARRLDQPDVAENARAQAIDAISDEGVMAATATSSTS
jgi:hypothetical protein